MSASSYDEALARLLEHEGGYSNHPSDPGGPTNWGITIFDYRRYVDPRATAADVRAMPVEAAKRIYREKYWNALSCDELPAGVDYCVFDYGVNSGIGRAARVLRRLTRLPHDGPITDEVVAATARFDAGRLVESICDERLAFLQSLRTWEVFGNGWGRRVREVRAAALAIAAGNGGAGLKPAPTGAGKEGTKGETTAKDRPPRPPVAKKVGWGAAAVAAVGAAAHWLDAHPLTTIAALVLAALVALVVISSTTNNHKGD
jgi:lysozyme family protein